MRKRPVLHGFIFHAITFILLMFVGCPPAFAQADNDNQSSSTDAGVLEEVKVTGSRIAREDVDSVAPVIQINIQEFTERGAMRFEEYLTRMPQITPSQGQNTTGNPSGTAEVNLRGLGAIRTLVLVNGRRLAYGSPTDIPSDINQVPMGLVKNVEILTGGASAVYGSDALAGVVNFTLRDDFEGVMVEATAGTYQHNNSNNRIQDMTKIWEENNPGQYTLPSSNVWDGWSDKVTAIAGRNFDEGKGNITIYASYASTEEVKMSERDYTICQLASAPSLPSGINCRPSPVGAPAALVNVGATGLPSQFRVADNQFLPRNSLLDQYNDQPFDQMLRDQKQTNFGGMFKYDLSDRMTAFFEGNIYQVDTVGDFSPTAVLNNGIVSRVGGFNCDNPFFSDQQRNFLCGNRGLSTGSNYDPVTGAYLGPDDVAKGLVINRRTVENGTRREQIDLDNSRFVLGVRGDIFDGLKYEIAGIYSDVKLNLINDTIQESRASLALNAVVDRRINPNGTPVNPSTFGRPTCAVNADATAANDSPGCAPIDYWSTNGPSPESVAFINSEAFAIGNTSLHNIVASISGDLGNYGIKSPLAESGIAFALGTEYRKNTLTMDFDAESIARGGFGAPIDNASTKFQEYFGELNVPLVQGKKLVEQLSVEGAYRYTDVKDADSINTYKLGAVWAPSSDFFFRASFQEATRSPNIIELFTGQSRAVTLQLQQNANGSFDPCSGAVPFSTFEQCARTGVKAADYGTIADNTFAGQLSGGNPNLQPETATTQTLGLVFQPSFLAGLTVTLDYFNIEVEDLVGTINANTTLRGCLKDGNPIFCNLIRRGPGGTLFASTDSYIATQLVNTGSLETSGLDVKVAYSFDMFSFGSLDTSLVGTYLSEYIVKPLPTSTPEQTFDCAGYHGFQCSNPKPDWRHVMQFGWNTPWDRVRLGATWRYISAVDISTRSSEPALTGNPIVFQDLSSANYIDLSAAFLATEKVTVRGGINNVFDKEPPLTSVIDRNAGGRGNTYLGFYDGLGRFLFASASYHF
ncbi:MAG: TonB-dependent receptor [Xanthomonadales bacterium]|nr:TonB-dependent receptor [Xanthomonadales bacterium]